MTRKASSADYYGTARDLRAAIEQSKLDRLFADRDLTEIVYILDTNMVEAYLRPTKRLSSSGSLSLGHLLTDATAAFVNDRLMVEFLLSGHLPGQKCGAAYMSASHWNEILKRADSWVTEIVRAKRSVRPGANVALEQFVNVRDLLEHAKKIVPEEVVDAIGDAAVVERRLRAAFGDDNSKIRPLERSKYWDTTTDRVRHDDFRTWRRLLTSIRRAHATANAMMTLRASRRRAGEDPLKTETHNIENDAWTLATLEALYRENPESCNDNRRLEFLFVTADRAIIEAVSRERERLEREGIPYFVRHPRVYSPVLNFSNMNITRFDHARAAPGALTRIFLEVEQAIDRLLVVDKWDVPNQTNQWSILRGNLRRWAAAARELAAINVDYLANDSETARRIAGLLNDSSTALDEASARLSETISEIRDEHVRVLSSEALRRLTHVLQAQLDLPQGIRVERRAPLKILGVDILDSVRQILPDRNERPPVRTLDELLQVLVSTGQTRDQTSRTIDEIGNHLRRRWNQAPSQLLAACIYLAVDAWDSARDCAARCRELTVAQKWSIWKREANYCFAVASRLALSNASRFDNARTALMENISTWDMHRSAGAKLAVLRDQVELAALLMSATVAQKAEQILGRDISRAEQELFAVVRESEVRQHFDNAVTKMEAAGRILDEEYSAPDLVDSQTVQRLKEQLFANLLGAYVLRQALGQDISDEPETNAPPTKRALGALEEAYDRRPLRLHAKVYRDVGLAQLNQGSPSDATMISEFSLRALTTVEEALKNQDLPYCDRQQFEFFRYYIQTYIRSIPIPQTA